MSPVVIIAIVVVLIIVFAVIASRRAGASQGGGAAVSTWTVTEVVKETPSTVSFGLDATLDFQPGQFVLLRPEASMPWRAYSFSRAPGQPLRLTVKRVENGKVSGYLTGKLEPGARLEVKGPYGQFLMPPNVTRALFVAGGSGVTPFLSWLHTLDGRGWPFPVTLITGNRSAQEQILKVELDALEKKAGGKLACVHVTDDAQGPLTKELLGSLLEKLEAPSLVATCGPEPMMNNVKELALTRWPGVAVLEEKFTASAEVVGDGPGVQLELMQDGKVKPFEVKPGEHVLHAARRAGYDLPAGCEMGACGACRVKLHSGDIAVPDEACLSDAEKAQGYRLICVGSVKGPARFESAP
ncbi:MAG: iron-sulfur cluster-binding domain-containing protein [Myxococcaceae bacterium]|nr:iron-sulfur cluster-binding domain-containing protein [Myxococcaceae bacterium]